MSTKTIHVSIAHSPLWEGKHLGSKSAQFVAWTAQVAFRLVLNTLGSHLKRRDKAPLSKNVIWEQGRHE
jgi:hypothetical protein